MGKLYSKHKVQESFDFQNLPWTVKVKNFFGKVKLYEYKLNYNDKEYVLVSKECFQNMTYSSKHLETFLKDFRGCNWKNKEEVGSFLELFKEINPKLFPKFYITHKYTQADEGLRKAYESALKWGKRAELVMVFDDEDDNTGNEFFLSYLNKMIELLDGIKEHDSEVTTRAKEHESIMREIRINDSTQKINDIKSKYDL